MATIKKPSEKFIPIPGSASISTSLAGAPGRASAAIGRVTAQLGATIQKRGERFADEANQALESSILGNAMNKATLSFSKRKQQRLQQSVDENGNPTFKDLPSDIANIGQEVLLETGATIVNPSVRQKFRQSFGNYITNQQISANGQARSQQLQFIQASVENSVNSFTEQAKTASSEEVGHFKNQVANVLGNAVAAGAISPLQSVRLQEKFRSEVAISRARNLIQSDPITALKILKENPSSLGLKTDEARMLRNQAENEISKQQRKTRIELAPRIAQANNLVKDAFKVLENNGEVSSNALNLILETSRLDAKLSRKANKLLQYQRVADKFNNLSVQERDSIISELKSRTDLNINQLETVKRLENAQKNLKNAIKKDPAALAMQQKLMDNIAPINFNKDLVAQLQQRTSLADKIKLMYGVTSSGLTNQELDSLREKLTNSTVSEQAKLFSDIVGAMGSRSLLLFSDLKKNGSDIYPMVGALVTEQQEEIAVRILQGRNVEKNNPEFVPKKNQVLEVINEEIPDYISPEHRKDVINAVRMLVAQKGFESKTLAEDIDDDVIKEALKLVTNGGAIEINNRKIEPPAPGVTEDDFEDFLTSMTAEQVQLLGGIKGHSGLNDEQISEIFENAEYQNIGRGKYLVYLETEGGASSLLLNEEGSPFILDYSKAQNNATSNEDPLDELENAIPGDTQGVINEVNKIPETELPSDAPTLNDTTPQSKTSTMPTNQEFGQVSSALNAAGESSPSLEHYSLAKSMIGQTETSHNVVLSNFFKKSLGRNINPRHTPWCAAFINSVLQTGGVTGTKRLTARSFLSFGKPTGNPLIGDIVVLRRPGGKPWEGHVGFFSGFSSNGNIKILGGNQNNQVSIKTFPARDLLGYRKVPKARSLNVIPE